MRIASAASICAGTAGPCAQLQAGVDRVAGSGWTGAADCRQRICQTCFSFGFRAVSANSPSGWRWGRSGRIFSDWCWAKRRSSSRLAQLVGVALFAFSKERAGIAVAAEFPSFASPQADISLVAYTIAAVLFTVLAMTRRAGVAIVAARSAIGAGDRWPGGGCRAASHSHGACGRRGCAIGDAHDRRRAGAEEPVATAEGRSGFPCRSPGYLAFRCAEREV